MATLKTRINITAELLALALSIEEDMLLGMIAEGKSRVKGKYIPHAKAWGLS